MRVVRSCYIAVSLLLCLVGSTIFGEEIRGPKMVLKEEAFDLGEVKEGAVIEHAFEVRNVGSEVLEIRDVKPG
jgi:hypothetical protein